MAIDLSPSGDNLREEISAIYDAPDKAAVTDTAPEPDSAPAAEVVEAEIPSRAVETRERNPDGTFKPKIESNAEAAPVEAAPATTEVPSTDTTAKVSTSSASDPSAPPAGWTADAKAAWSNLAKELPTLSPTAQAAVRTVQTAALKREETVEAGSRQWSEQRRRYEQLLAPVAQEAQAHGLGLEQGLNALVRAQQMLSRDAPGALRQLAQQYGVDLATLAGHPAAERQREASQPDISALVQRAVQPLLAPIQQQFQAEQTRKSEESIAFVTEFANRDAHKHFATVENEIMALIPVIQASNPTWDRGKVLQDAYDRAVHANPTTRTALQADAEAAAEAKRRAEASARATKARTAASSVTGAPNGAAVVNVPKDSLRAEIEAAMTG